MKPSLSALIIGAGGVASYMLPALKNSFDLEGVLVDGDKLEEHNLDRQIFGPRQIGQFKAEALVKHHKLPLAPVNHYVDDSFPHTVESIGYSFDIVICLVDNHPARRVALATSRQHDIPILICANEYTTSQAIYWHPEWGGITAPDTRYEEMRTSNAGSPIRCTGDALESDPQLAIANQVSAALGNFLIWRWHGEKPCSVEDPLGHEPVEIQTTFGKVETITTGDILNG